jgi:hypothetical protein
MPLLSSGFRFKQSKGEKGGTEAGKNACERLTDQSNHADCEPVGLEGNQLGSEASDGPFDSQLLAIRTVNELALIAFDLFRDVAYKTEDSRGTGGVLNDAS